MFNIYLGYPDEHEEIEIGERTTVDAKPDLKVVMNGEEIIQYQALVRKVPVARHVTTYATHLVRATRPNEPYASDLAKKWIQWGAGPRAVQNLLLGGKARAILRGQFHVSVEDVRACALSVLRHRILPNFAAEAEGVDSVRIVRELIKAVPEPKQ